MLRLALFTMAKASQHRYPVARFNALLHIVINGIMFAKTHYSSLLMTTLWSAPCLVMISQKDEVLVRYLLTEAHILVIPQNAGPSLHLPQHITMNRILSSTLSPVFMDNLRQLVSSFISNCFHCNKVQARGGRFRPFSHVLTDPWVAVKMREFNASSTFFSKISLDNLTVKVRKSRVRKSDYAYLSLLFGVDCCTGFFFCLPMNDLSCLLYTSPSPRDS